MSNAFDSLIKALFAINEIEKKSAFVKFGEDGSSNLQAIINEIHPEEFNLEIKSRSSNVTNVTRTETEIIFESTATDLNCTLILEIQLKIKIKQIDFFNIFKEIFQLAVLDPAF